MMDNFEFYDDATLQIAGSTRHGAIVGQGRQKDDRRTTERACRMKWNTSVHDVKNVICIGTSCSGDEKR